MDFQLQLDSETVDRAHPVAPVCVEPDVPLRDVLLVLKQQERGAVLVCRDGVLSGIFTERDALRLIASGADFSQPIGEVMVTDPAAVSNADTVGRAIEGMSSGGYRRLPIVDDKKRPVGMLKATGILHFLVEHFPQTIYTLPPTPHTTRDREGA